MEQKQAHSEQLQAQAAQIWRRVVEAVGWLCIILGIAGAILPILPAWPFLLPGVLLLGPRNRKLRLAASRLRLALRLGSRHPNRGVRLPARILAFQERSLRQSLGPLFRRWAEAEASGRAASPLRYLTLLLPPAAIAVTVFIVIKLLALL